MRSIGVSRSKFSKQSNVRKTIENLKGRARKAARDVKPTRVQKTRNEVEKHVSELYISAE